MGRFIVKSEIRIVGWDDTPFSFNDTHTILLGVIYRGGSWMDGIITAIIAVDGLDVTDKIITAIKNSKHYEQLRVIMLNGITFGGFNIIDMQKVFKQTKLPVIAVVRNKPNLKDMKKALLKFKDFDYRWGLIEKAGKVYSLNVINRKTEKIKKIWYQKVGIEKNATEKIIKISSTHSFIPEPLRIAHLIGSGLKTVKL